MNLRRLAFTASSIIVTALCLGIMGASAQGLSFGNYYALVIGNRNYQDPAIADLKNPERDARAIANLLQSRMQVTVVIDGTRGDIWGALGAIIKGSLQESDFRVRQARTGREHALFTPRGATAWS